MGTPTFCIALKDLPCWNPLLQGAMFSCKMNTHPNLLRKYAFHLFDLLGIHRDFRCLPTQPRFFSVFRGSYTPSHRIRSKTMWKLPWWLSSSLDTQGWDDCEKYLNIYPPIPPLIYLSTHVSMIWYLWYLAMYLYIIYLYIIMSFWLAHCSICTSSLPKNMLPSGAEDPSHRAFRWHFSLPDGSRGDWHSM